MPTFLHIRSAKFPILPGEREEVLNPGTFGKAFAQYLQHELVRLGYRIPFVCSEDWGWWVEQRLERVEAQLRWLTGLAVSTLAAEVVRIALAALRAP